MEFLAPKEIKANRRTKSSARFWGVIIFIVLMLALFVRWSEWHTNTAEAAYDKYEQCVENTYGVSATKFYQVYGESANCK